MGYGGDYPSQIVDIKGSTINKITVPYLWSTPYRMTIPAGVNPDSGFQLTPKVTIECLSLPIASQGSDPIISLAIFRAAGEDYQLASLCSSQIDPLYVYPFTALTSTTTTTTTQSTKTTTTNIVVKGQASLANEFSRQFAPISCECHMAVEQGFTTTETIGTVDDILKRFATLPDPATTIQQTRPKIFSGVGTTYFEIGPGSDPTETFYLQPYFQLLNCFKYQRGSLRVRYVESTTPTQSTVWFTPSTLGGVADQGSGFQIWKPLSNPTYTIEVPWIGTVAQLPTDVTKSIYEIEQMNIATFTNTTLGTAVYLYVASGDDRNYNYIMPPAKFQYVPGAMLKSSASTKLSKQKAKG